ncbi:hypothetical protein DPMN_031012 [Dreissena polymorpha]|uniref:NACHT domain-containing protein n=1 Tax=Dreissena polymorpha TaxID=45954 RepID=A0A9D4LZ69_DREPO|nr:hypothetical protein DPMN_031012 [Dreissena polymorpha]
MTVLSDISDFQQRLMQHYNDTSSYVPLSTLDQSLDKRLIDIYAIPKIHRIEIEKDGRRVKKEQVLTYKELFFTDDNENKRIYLQGEPGTGKSTFSANLVHDWRHGNQPFSAVQRQTEAFEDLSTITQFKFLFFISLRDARGQSDVTHMIKKQLIDKIFSEDQCQDVYKLFVHIIKTEKCLFVLEGLDEWVCPDGSYLAVPSMAGFPMENCTVLITSRPWKLADERIRNSHIDILLEIEGVSNWYKFSERVLRCIIDETNDLANTMEEFQTFIRKRGLRALSSSPILYTLVMCTWIDTMRKEEDMKEASNCALYTALLESLCKKANSTSGDFIYSNPSPVRCFCETSNMQPNIAHLEKLAEAACKLLFSAERESSIVFNNITLSHYFSWEDFTDHKMFALKAGILTNRKDTSWTGSSYSFIDKTMQEFLAAYHIACNLHVIDDIIYYYLKRNKSSYLDISQVFIFLCGMNIFAANKLSGLMNECDVAYSKCSSEDSHEFQSIIESGIKEAAANRQDGSGLKLSHFNITAENMRELHRLWSTNTSNVLTLHLRTDVSSPEPGKPESRYEFNLSSCHKLKSLELLGNGICLRGKVYVLFLAPAKVWFGVHPFVLSSVLQSVTNFSGLFLRSYTRYVHETSLMYIYEWGEMPCSRTITLHFLK